MTETHTCTEPQSDVDLADFPRPRTDEDAPSSDRIPLASHLSCARYTIGTSDDYGVRVLTNESEEYATIHLQIPAALPAPFAAQLAPFSMQCVLYTDRDREWDQPGDGPTSDQRYWSAFVDSVIAAVNFARAAVKSAVWAHARGDEWSWSYSPPGRVEAKYELWGDKHPNTYDPEDDYETYAREVKERSAAPVDNPVEL
ncbi:hypothetical protein [Microbacterium sp.]|uniref:hypothetical protein n=1 Tax=Microbacterium sp. TaxID=51671 RepID=UPI003A90B7D1